MIIGCETGGISREAKALLSNLGWYVKSFVPVEQKYFCEFAPVWVILSRQKNTNLLFLPSDNYLKEVPQKCAELLLNGDVQLWTQHNCVSARNDFRGYAVENCQNNIKAILENSDGFQLVKLGKILQPFTKDRGRNETDSIFSIEKFLSHDYRKLGPDFYENYNLDPSFNINDPLKNNTLEFLVKNDTIAKYLQYIFNTELGKWILGASGVHLHDVMDSANNFVFKVELDSLLIEKIPLPDETKMKEMLSTHENLSKLKFHISRLESMLILESNETDTVCKDAFNLLSAIKLLTEADRIQSLIRSGESKTLEFKQTLSWCIKGKQKSNDVELGALKTISGFLNTDGGTLLIGVEDQERKIIGLQNEINKLHKGSEDRFLLYLKNKIKDKIGESFYPFLEWSIVPVKNQLVLRLDVKPTQEPSFIDDVFYVRTNPATDRLIGQKLYNYLKQRFPQ